MQFLNQLAAEDRDRCLRVLSAVADIRTRQGLQRWLGGMDMQNLLPHDVVLMAWGDIRAGKCQLDVVSDLDGVDTATADSDRLRPRVQQLHARWQVQQRPCAVDADVLEGIFPGTWRPGRSALVQGLRDQRTGQDSCCIVVSKTMAPVDRATDALAALLPYIDLGFRQATVPPPVRTAGGVTAGHLPALHRMPAEQITLSDAPAPSPTMGMTEREQQIMHWVEMGKTNQEIGTILNISAFTVKNHLQRIFKKLDVYSRAQAVSRFKDSMLYG